MNTKLKAEAGTIVRFSEQTLLAGQLAQVIRVEGADEEGATFWMRTERGGDGRGACAVREDFKVLAEQPQGWTPMGQRLPYGMWTCADGREVLFNRHYKPIWQRWPVERAQTGEWVTHASAGWFYTDGSQPWRHPAEVPKIERVLADFLEGRPVRDRFVNER